MAKSEPRPEQEAGTRMYRYSMSSGKTRNWLQQKSSVRVELSLQVAGRHAEVAGMGRIIYCV